MPLCFVNICDVYVSVGFMIVICSPEISSESLQTDENRLMATCFAYATDFSDSEPPE